MRNNVKLTASKYSFTLSLIFLMRAKGFNFCIYSENEQWPEVIPSINCSANQELQFKPCAKEKRNLEYVFFSSKAYECRVRQ